MSAEEAGQESDSKPASQNVFQQHISGMGAFAVFFVYLYSGLVALNHDAALFLYSGRLITEGNFPYVDFVEINPPLVMYLSALPTLIFKGAWFSLEDGFNAFCGLIFAFSWWGIRYSLVRCRVLIPELIAGAIRISWLGFAFWLIFIPEANFAQREHLFLMLYLPFFFLRIARYEGTSCHLITATAFGIAAGVGACLKPHFLLIALSVEVCLLVSRRNVRPLLSPESLGFLFFGLSYALHFLLLPSEMRDALFGRWIPLIARGYGAYNVSASTLIANVSLYVAIFLIGLGSSLKIGGRLRDSILAMPVLVFTAASVLVYFVEGKGWDYHLIPLNYGSILLTIILIATLLSKLFPRHFGSSGQLGRDTRVQGNFLLISFYVVFLGAMLISWQRIGPAPKGPIDQILSSLYTEGPPATTSPPDPVLIISTSVAEVFPRVVDLNLEIASRYLWTFPIALLYADAPDYPEGFPYHPMDDSPPEELQFLQELGDDIVNNAPKVIVIDHDGQSQGCPVGFNPADYLLVNGFVERYMTNYKAPLDIMGKKVYYRKDMRS